MPKLGLLQQIEKDFGSFTNFKENFLEAALSLFGSGWVWLVCKTLPYIEFSLFEWNIYCLDLLLVSFSIYCEMGL